MRVENTAAWRDHVVKHTETPRTLPRYGHPARVSSEVLDVVPDPGHGHSLVQQALVTGNLVNSETEPTQRAHSVVDSDEDDVVSHPELWPVPVTGT